MDRQRRPKGKSQSKGLIEWGERCHRDNNELLETRKTSELRVKKDPVWEFATDDLSKSTPGGGSAA